MAENDQAHDYPGTEDEPAKGKADLRPGFPDAGPGVVDHSGDPDHGTDMEGFDPTAGVVGKYAAQPNPGDSRPGGKDLGPNLPEGAKKAPQLDKPGTPAVGPGVPPSA